MESSKLKVKCTYRDCNKHFETVKQMKTHKKDDEDHYYCRRCDVDCLDWEDLTLHKVEKMQPFLEGGKRDEPDESPMHIVCEFCGEDFKSFGGRKAHRAQYHAAKQNVTCPGCYSIFGEASHLIRHFEQNKCEQISYRTYVGYVTHQHVNAQIKKDENKYIEGLLVNDQFAGPSDRSPLAVVGPAISDHDGEDEDEGGIILDHDDEAQWAGIKPLVPQASSTTRATSNTIAWLSLSRSDELTEGFSNMIISPGPDWRRGGDTAGGDWQRSVEPTESCPVLRSALKKTNSTAVSAGGDGEASAWTIGATSKALFKDAKPTPPRPGAWNDIVKQRKEAALGPHIDVTRLRFWDPSAKEYNVDRFLHSVTLKYCCPFPECGCDYEAPGELEEHLQIGHLRTDFHCPGCLKRFPLGSSLIAHAEASNGRCKVRNASYFNKLLEQVSGGFLSAEELYQPKVHKVNQSALARRGDVVEGVMDTKFTAHMPTELQK